MCFGKRGRSAIAKEVLSGGITVRRALQIGGLARASLVAGARGLDRVIKYVDIMEVPDVAAWLRPDMLMITCAYAIREDPVAQVNLVRNLSRCGAAALAVKPARFLGSMPQGMIDAANEEGLPLLELPADLPYIEITHPLLSEILNEQVRDLQHDADVFLKLTRLVLEQKGLQSVAMTLSEGLRAEVYILDNNMHVLARSTTDTLDAASPEDSIFTDNMFSGDRVFAAPIRSSGKLLGYVAVNTAGRGPLTSYEIKTVEQAAIVTGLEISRLNAVRETEMRLKADFFSEVLSGSAPSADMMAAKARMLGIDVECPFYIMVVQVQPVRPAPRDAAGRSPGPAPHPRTLAEIARRQCLVSGVQAVVLEFQDSIVVICSQQAGSMQPGAAELAGRIVTTLKDILPFRNAVISAGVSLTHTGVLSFAAAYAEARKALDFGSVVYRHRNVISYQDLQPYLLLENVERQVLGKYWEDQLGRLAREDRRLLDTLKTFLDCGGEMKKTSEALFVHRNTLDYRLKKIEGLLGCDIREPQTQFRLRVALLAGVVAGMVGDAQAPLRRRTNPPSKDRLP